MRFIGEPTAPRSNIRRTIAIALAFSVGAVVFARTEVGRVRPLDVSFDPKTNRVTIRLAVQDPTGYFIPNLRPENFVVYENGTLQPHASAEIEHLPVALSVLVEGGGRYQELNGILNMEIPWIGGKLRDVIVPGDRVAVYTYANRVQPVFSVEQPPASLDSVFTSFRIGGVSEANLYDALVDVLDRSRASSGRTALLLISTGFDSFSHVTFKEVVAKAERSATPIYSVGLAGLVQRSVLSGGPLAKLDWARANRELRTLARVSEGRAYLRDSALDVPAVYDDVMEHLRVRYVIRYVAHGGPSGSPRSVRVVLVDPRTGGPLRVVDQSGKAIVASVSAESSYTP